MPITGTWLTHWIGRPLVRLNFDQQRCEADFRFGLVRFRENTEGVALYGGEADELRGFRERFEAVATQLVGHHAPAEAADLLHRGLPTSGVDLPICRRGAALSSRASLRSGGLIQTIGAFSQVQASLSFFVQSYKQIAEWCSVVERLSGFERALERVRIQAATGGGVRRADGDVTHLTVEGVDLYLPDGQPLIADVNLSLLRGDTVLLGELRVRERVRSSAPSPESGRLGAARSAGLATPRSSFYRRSHTCRSARFGKW